MLEQSFQTLGDGDLGRNGGSVTDGGDDESLGWIGMDNYMYCLIY